MLLLQACTASPSFNMPNQRAHLLISVTLCWHIITTQSPLFMSWCCVSFGFRQTYDNMYPFIVSYRIFFSAPKSLCVLPVYPFIHPQPPGNHWSFYCLHDFAFSRVSCSWCPTVSSLLKWAVFPQQYAFMVLCVYVCLVIPCLFMAHFFLVLNHTALSGCAGLPIHLLKGILVPSRFWQLRVKLL